MADNGDGEYLTFHDVLLKIQTQLHLLERIHLQQLPNADSSPSLISPEAIKVREIQAVLSWKGFPEDAKRMPQKMDVQYSRRRVWPNLDVGSEKSPAEMEKELDQRQVSTANGETDIGESVQVVLAVEGSGDGRSFRKRQRKQESKKIHKTNGKSEDTVCFNNAGETGQPNIHSESDKISSHSPEEGIAEAERPNSDNWVKGSQTTQAINETHIANQDLRLQDVSVKTEAWELYRDLVHRVADLLGSKHEQDRRRNDEVAKLKDSLAKERLENESLGAEVAVLREKLGEVLQFAEDGSSKSTCKYCLSVKEKLKAVLEPESKITYSSFDPRDADRTGHLDFRGPQVTKAMEESDCFQSPEDECSSLKRKTVTNECKLEDKRFKRGKLVMPPSESNLELHQGNLVSGFHHAFPRKGLLDSSHPIATETAGATILGSSSSEQLELSEAFSSENHDVRAVQERDLETHQKKMTNSGEAQTKCNLEDKGNAIDREEMDANRNEKHPSDCQDFSEDIMKFIGLEDKYIELECGCTSSKYGDTVGTLRVHRTGKLEIFCDCSSECRKGKPMSPAAFEKHGGRGASRKWKDSIWVILGRQKVQFSKVKNLDNLHGGYKTTRHLSRGTFHRDEFVKCSKCGKERRFKCRNKNDCHIYHNASLNPAWKCSDSCFSCEGDDEEREARRLIRGCKQDRACPGCIACVCVGCYMCRFGDCDCRTCQEFMSNSTS